MKLLFFVSIVGVILLCPTVCRSQTWNMVYEGDYVPTDPPGGGQDLQLLTDNPFDPSLELNAGAQLPTTSPSYLHFEDNVSAPDQKWDEFEAVNSAGLDESFADGGTMVMRLRRQAGAVGEGNVRSFNIESTVGDRWAIQVGRDNGIFIESVSDGGGAINVGNINDWHVYRFAFAPEAGHFRIRAYINGSTTAATDVVTDWGTSGDLWKTGSSSPGTGEYDLDWLLVTDDGAFPPGSGPLPPDGFDEGYTGPWEPTWTPAPTLTATPTPLVPNFVVNGGFETDDLTGWTRYYAVSCKNGDDSSRFQVRSSTCTVWIPSVCYIEGTHHLRLDNGQRQVGALDGIMQVVSGLDPGIGHRLEMAGMIRTEEPGDPADDFLRLWWLPREFTETIPTPGDLCNPANFPGDAELVAEWTPETGTPGEHWVYLSGYVSTPTGTGTIFIDAQFDDPESDYAINAVYVDDVGLYPPASPATGLGGSWETYQ